MSVHALLSPSKRHRWKLCPGSVREEAKYPEIASNPAAADGTHSHTLLEHCLKENVPPESMVGQTLTDHEGTFTVDADRAARVKVATDYVKKRVDENLGLCQVISERQVNPAALVGREDMKGTVDIQLHTPLELELIDFKDGMGVVLAQDNPQLELYAVGCLAEYAEHGESAPWVKVRMTIIQPKLALRGMSPISSHEVSVHDLNNIVMSLMMEGAACDQPDAPLVPGEDQCKFCKAKGSCSALASNVMKEIGVMFQPVTDVAQQSADKDPSTMGDDQIRQILEAAPLMRQLLEGVEAEALRRMQAGHAIPGLKLVNGRGSRVWSLPEEQMAEKLVKMGIPKGAVYETKLVSPAKAEKLTWQKRDGTKMQLSERQLKTMETEYVTKMAGKLTVVPESDSRAAVVTNAAPMFSAVQAAPTAESLPSWLS